MENEDFSANLPPTEFPASEDVREIKPHAVDEEEIPTLEALAKDSHFTETTTRATAREEHSGRGLGLDEDLRTHLDAGAELASYVTEEPILRDTEARMLMECLDEQLAVPQSDSAVRESSRTDATSEVALNTAQLVFEILRLLAVISLGAVGADTLDGIAETHNVALQPLSNDRKVRWQGAVIVNQQDILEAFGSITADELSDDLRTDRGPQMVNTVRATHLLRVIQRCWAVAIRENIDVRGRENLQRCL